MIRTGNQIYVPQKWADGYFFPDFVTMDRELEDFDPGIQGDLHKFDGRAEIWNNAIELMEGVFSGDKLLNEFYFAGQRAVIVGAGPSLDRNIKKLERRRGKALFVGINRACQMFRPDIGICLDPAAGQDIYPDGKYGIVVNTIANPAIMNNTTECTFSVFNTNASLVYHPQFRGYFPFLFSHSNSMITALHLIYKMGFRSVEFAGCDFCYPDCGNYYAGGRPRHVPGDEGGEFPVDFDGEKWITNKNLIKHVRNVACAIYWLQKASVRFKRPQGVLGHYIKIMERF